MLNFKNKKRKKWRVDNYSIMIICGGIGLILTTIFPIIAKIMIDNIVGIENFPVLEFFTGDWIGFWSAYAGNMLTIVSIGFALYTFNQEREDVKENERPFILPLNKTFKAKENTNGRVKLIDTTMGYSDAREKMIQKVSFKVDAINIGKEHALEVKTSISSAWDLFSKCDNPFTKQPFMTENAYKSHFFNKDKEVKLTQVIENQESAESVFELLDFKHIIEVILNEISKKATLGELIDRAGSSFNEDILSIPIGRLKIEYLNIYNKEYPLTYVCNVNIEFANEEIFYDKVDLVFNLESIK